MPHNEEDAKGEKPKKDDDWWWIIIFIIIYSSSSDAQPQALRRPDTTFASARAIFARADSAAGRIGGISKHRYSHTISETEAPSVAQSAKTVTEVWTIAPNRALTRMTMPGAGTMEIGYNGTVGWTTSPMTGPVVLEGDQLKQLIANIENRDRMYASFKILSSGARLVVEGKDVVPVSFEDRKGNAGTLYFDAKTGLLHAIRLTDSANPAATVLSVASDYQRIDGELVAMTTTMKMGAQSMVTRITHVDHKVLDTAQFTPPAAVRELLKRP